MMLSGKEYQGQGHIPKVKVKAKDFKAKVSELSCHENSSPVYLNNALDVQVVQVNL